jgi:hypothetical protein
MSAEKFPTLSSSLASYVKLMKHVAQFKSSPEARKSGSFLSALTACEQKLKKFFNISSQQSVYYYIATGNKLLCIYIFMMPTPYFHSS